MKEHVRRGPVTEEQRSRRAILGETVRVEAFLSCGFVARRPAVAGSMKDMATPRSSSRIAGPKILSAAMSIVF
jgi:hypothetical protein